MRSTFAILALVAGVFARPQGVTSMIAPSATAPAGCSPTYPGTFEITVVNVTTSKRRSLAERQAAGVLTLSLAGGKLMDQAGRTGYIASNFQFQFDNPPQTGAIFTSGFSVCGNESLALGGSAVFYQCNSGGFFNLYDRSWAAQCSPVYLVAMGGASPVSESSDGQGIATAAATAPISIKSEGQPIGTTALAPISIKSEGQPIGTTVLASVPVSQITDGQPQGQTPVPVTQISDGQPQGPTGVPVTQISDGQLQATTAAPAVSQISDGQLQATTAAPAVSQISDGQLQATTAAPAVSQATDGQIIASTPTTPAGVPISQISDGQPQAPTNGTVSLTASPSQFTGAAASAVYGFGAMAAGVIGVVAML